MKGRIGTSKRLTCHWTITKQEVVSNSLSKKYPHLVFKFKVLFVFFPGSFQTTDSLPPAGKNHSVFSIEYFLFSVACLKNSVGWSSEEVKFPVEFLPLSFFPKCC